VRATSGESIPATTEPPPVVTAVEREGRCQLIVSTLEVSYGDRHRGSSIAAPMTSRPGAGATTSAQEWRIQCRPDLST